MFVDGRYDDFVDGDRLKRIYVALDNLRPGLSALTCVLFFDAINRDKKGLNVLFSARYNVWIYVSV